MPEYLPVCERLHVPFDQTGLEKTKTQRTLLNCRDLFYTVKMDVQCSMLLYIKIKYVCA